MKDNNCIFCKLANGDIPTTSIYEDDDFNVIFDAGPATLGHALVIPKNHFVNIYDIDSDTLAKAHRLAKKIAIVLTDVFGADGVNILQNSNEAAGQSVPHFHIHVIPRYKDDNAIRFWTPGTQDAAALAEKLEEIRKKAAEK